MTDPAVVSAASAIESYASMMVTTPIGAGEPELNETVFPRLSVERRVLGYITDEVDVIQIGPRNTLAAITYALMTDRQTTNPPEGTPRLETEGKDAAVIIEDVLGKLTALIDAGLVEQRQDQSYAVTEAGQAELKG